MESSQTRTSRIDTLLLAVSGHVMRKTYRRWRLDSDRDHRVVTRLRSSPKDAPDVLPTNPEFGVDTAVWYWAGQFIGAFIGGVVYLHFLPH